MTALQTPTFAERYVEADGFDIRYKEAGSGEPVVALHGAGGMRVSRAHELLAERFRVIAFEVPGFGQSPANERTTSLDDLARTMLEAAANLGLEQFHLMGNSFGGGLALRMAIQQPERLKTLVLVAPAAIRPEAPAAVSPEERAGLLYAHPERQPPMPPPDPAVVAKQQALLDRLRRPPRDPQLEAQLPNLHVPTLVLIGTEDRVIPPEMGRYYREKLPKCHFVLVYDAGHALDADRPEAFAAVVGDFISHHEGFLISHESGLRYP